MGPLMLDCQAEELSAEEREKLAHPVTGGVILFSRNYADPKQVAALIKDIRSSAKKPILIAVDHEGGRVQRFREHFTQLPAMGAITEVAKTSQEAEQLAKACGLVMGYELKQLDVDFSFAPVLDVNGISEVIGDRAFSDCPQQVITLASALIDGLDGMSMPAIGKHFPGHGSIAPDSHIALPVDERSFGDIQALDLVPFTSLIRDNRLSGIMPAHVIYSQVDSQPAGFSRVWLQEILRETLGFKGAIFSDDLSMHGASVAGDYVTRAHVALDAGCDMVLACNNPKGAEQILDALSHDISTPKSLMTMYAKKLDGAASGLYKEAKQRILNAFGDTV
ncbi:beta-N-acetylhexosaminidase [Alteromonas sp. KUL49]|uniref:beta-N-acetylhexosaminidase n=2 Tax=Alteromonas sp. KUL49 TaxID=2480798 RepID=UPI0010FFBC87|nr:beta-N-acetylhexosaminidase [Alteromonas sp. KUL49]GEA11342.1 beta-hexosaminidase [Alteromonas sp. KUL49]